MLQLKPNIYFLIILIFSLTIFSCGPFYKAPPKPIVITDDDDDDEPEDDFIRVKDNELIESVTIVDNSKDFTLSNFTINFKYPFDDSKNGDYLSLLVNGTGEKITIPRNRIKLEGDKKKISAYFTNFSSINTTIYYNQSYNFKLQTSPYFKLDGTNYHPILDKTSKIITFETKKFTFPGMLTIKQKNILGDKDDVFFKTVYSDPDSFHRKAIEKGKLAHQLKSLKDEGLTGKDINVMLYDLGIPSYADDLPVQKAIVYRYPFVDSTLEKSMDYRRVDSHAHRMAGYMLDYAHQVNIWDCRADDNFMFTNKAPDAYHFRQFVYDENNNLLNKNKVDIVSASSFNGGDKDGSVITILKEMLKNGLIYNNSIGNENYLKNTLDSYRTGQEQKFTPYYLDLDSAEFAKGAWVQVQAVIYTPSSILTPKALYKRDKSKAGLCRFYTVSVIENGAGATSQATATFSGMLAMLMQYNKEQSKGYTPREIVEIIMETADDIQEDDETIDNTDSGDGLDESYGHGLVNLKAALDKMKTGDKATYKLYQETAFKNLKQSVKDHARAEGVKF